MISQSKFSSKELIDALLDSGLEENDLVYLSSRMFGIGMMEGVFTREDFLTQIYEAIRTVLGTGGTLVVPTFTQQVGLYGVSYHHETTPCLTGIFSEWVRNHSESIRSLHPVFSVAAIGPNAEAVCSDISPVAFGRDSSFDRMDKLGGKLLCLGFGYYTGHIVSTMHYVETMFAVPYYYNKLVLADCYFEGRKITQQFVINVKYADYLCIFDFNSYIDALAKKGVIRSASIGCGMIYSNDIQLTNQVGNDLLKSNLNMFLSAPPTYIHGEIPCDGPPELGMEASIVNLAGVLI